MSFVAKSSLNGSAEVLEEVLASNVSITKNTILYGASGYATNATVGNITVFNMIGVVVDTVDNSGGSAGDKSVHINVNPATVYLAGSTGTVAQSQVWTNVTLETVGTIDEDDPLTAGNTGDTAVAKIRAMVSTSQALVSLNFGPVADV